MTLHVLQVADFGLLSIRRQTQHRDEEHAKYQRRLWSAPEVLRQHDDVSGGATTQRTQKADVYAFGVILYEIVGRRGPYGDVELSPKGLRPTSIRKYTLIVRFFQFKQRAPT